MGSTNFEQFVPITDPDRAYRSAVEDALHEHGHEGYNGTISTTSSFVLVTHTPRTRKEAGKLAEEKLDDFGKWGPCGAIPVLEDGKVSGARELRVEVDVDGAKRQHEAQPELEAGVRAKVRLRAGEEIIGWEVEQPQWERVPSAGAAGRYVGGPQRKAAVKVAATAGKTEARYFCLPAGHAQLPEWKTGHASQALARSALDAWLKERSGQLGNMGDDAAVAYEIVGITRRVGGEPLVRATAEVTRTRYPIKVTVGKVARSDKLAGYLFFGWVAM